MMGMGGGGQSAGGSGQGGTVFEPPNQAAAADAFAQMAVPLFNTAFSGAESVGARGDPSAVAYPQAQEAVGRGLTQSPYAWQALDSADQAKNYGISSLFPQAQAGSSALYDQGMYGLPYAGQAIHEGFDPRYGEAISGIQNNPYFSQAMEGAQQGARIGAAGADRLAGAAGNALDLGNSSRWEDLVNSAINDPGFVSAREGALQGAQLGRQGANQLQGMAGQIANTGFDPQSALFNRSQGQLMDQTSAINAMSGLSGTPYGASVAANALGNFGINWQDKQLGRQTQAAGAASPLYQAAPQLAAISGALPSAAQRQHDQDISGALGRQLGASTAGLSAALPGYQGASQLAGSAAGMPSSVYTGQIGQMLEALKARGAGGVQGAASWDALMKGGGQGLAQAQSIGGTGADVLTKLGAGPYNVGAGMAQNALGGLERQTNLGNEAFKLPQNVMNQMLAYLGKGQSASQTSGQLGQQGFNQTAQGVGGMLSGANTLFGNGGLASGAGSLFGPAAAAGSAITDFGAGGAALGIADVFGGGAATAAMVPEVAAMAPLAAAGSM